MKYLKYFEASLHGDRLKKTKERFSKSMNRMTLEQTVDFVVKNCQEYINNPVKIRRSIVSGDLSSYFYSEPVLRYSRDNANYYTLLMDNLPEWKDYPRRKKSFICSLSKPHLYGEDYVVIPIDGSKWAISPDYDIYHCFNKTLTEYGYYEDNIEEFFSKMKKTAKEINIILNDSNFRIFKSQIKQIDKHHMTDLWDDIVNIVQPQPNGFQLMTLPELYEDVKSDQLGSSRSLVDNSLEVWTDSPCVFIKNELYDDFNNLLEKTNVWSAISFTNIQPIGIEK